MAGYHFETFGNVYERSRNFGMGIKTLLQREEKNAPKNDEPSGIVIFAETRGEWMIAAQGAFQFSLPVATLLSLIHI